MDMPSQTITDPPQNWSCWMMLQAEERSPRHLQTLSCLSHVLRLNLLSAVESTGRQWRTYQFWQSVANVNQAAAVRGSQQRAHCRTSDLQTTLMESVFDWSETFTPVYRRSFCWTLAVLSLFLLAQRSRERPCWGFKDLIQPCPALLEGPSSAPFVYFINNKAAETD